METAKKKSQGNSLKKSLPGILVSVLIVVILLRFVDFKEVIGSFRNVSLKLLAAIFLLQTVAFIFRGLAWRVILDGRPTVMQSYWTVTEGYLLNLLPLRLGEVGRAVIMGGLIQRSPFYVFSTVILERLVDVVITLIMLVLTVPLVSGAGFSGGTYTILFVLVLAGLAAIFLVVRNQEKFLALLGKVIRPDSKAGKFILPKVASILSGMQILNQPRKFLVWMFWILLAWLCWWLTMIVSMRVFFPQLPLWASFFTQSITALGGAIPSAPAGLGVIEGAFVVALSFLGVGQSEALAFGILNHSMGIITPVFWGIIGFLVQGQKFSEVFSGLQNAELSEEKDTE
mgnify:CR=1 FL=1